ncbi:hypothetical protein WR25_22572 [Diploscapter pachys]|uniref:Uncharacterized protein n=1 Tax=Diploscapter pachys TaxID=2018661 RepID=A0A2A2K3Y2_9BILA|nr:hypothetical protein WR25_22572 [Diploscapter pachys]
MNDKPTGSPLTSPIGTPRLGIGRLDQYLCARRRQHTVDRPARRLQRFRPRGYVVGIAQAFGLRRHLENLLPEERHFLRRMIAIEGDQLV